MVVGYFYWFSIVFGVCDMLPGIQTLAQGLGLRPARLGDAAFLASLYRSTRWDLQLLDAEKDFIETVLDMQQNAQTVGYGDDHPDAMNFIVEKLGESVGRVMVLFGPNEVRVLDLSLVPAVRGLGFGTAVLRALQQAADQVKSPLSLCVLRHNQAARQLYYTLGFKLAASDPMVDLMVWYPEMLQPGVQVKQ